MAQHQMDDSQEIDPADIDIISKIGEGTTASVYLAELQGRKVAVKEIRVFQTANGGSTFEHARREFCMLSVVVHPNILQLVGLICQSNPVRLVLEYCEGGSLFDLLHNRRDLVLSWAQRLKVLLDTTRAMDYLHTFEPPIIHRDLKSLNLMLLHTVTDQHVCPHVKLGDFGLARVQDAAMTQGVGTKHWMAPEVLSSTGYTEKADIFSFAMVSYEVICSHVPYERLEPQQVAGKIASGRRPHFEDHIDPDEVPKGLIELVRRCWEQCPSDRPTSAEISSGVRRIVVATPAVVSL